MQAQDHTARHPHRGVRNGNRNSHIGLIAQNKGTRAALVHIPRAPISMTFLELFLRPQTFPGGPISCEKSFIT
jgi:hypothetical protein